MPVRTNNLSDLTNGPQQCMINGCIRLAGPAYARGLCLRCYSQAKKVVTSGTHTWQTLAAMGLCRPDEETDAFGRALRKATSEDKDASTEPSTS